MKCVKFPTALLVTERLDISVTECYVSNVNGRESKVLGRAYNAYMFSQVLVDQ
jgi:hypothetical protein